MQCTRGDYAWVAPKFLKMAHIPSQTYLVLIHAVPTSFDMSCDSEDVNFHLLELNKDIIPHPPALQDAKFLKGNHGQVPHKTHCDTDH